ncbi:element excision factor XisI family protein [Cyanobacterium aponinum AL20118]|uniref:Element excision factor XisI family protein n=2 Tax=Cyanobacterium TaxID=102234 RepID=A0AAF1C657_9CHRO|nr:element excision factor XisI family protein [Cyanobacterium aponinum]WPF89575.1 element excision factor XisI family protein [Cyanobacterium aponinum AL20115]
MDKSITYADILTKVLRQQSAIQPRLQNLKISSVCDRDTGHFLIIMTGWHKESWRDQILFHARLIDDKIIIEDDNFEEGLTNILIQEGIDDRDIITEIEQMPKIEDILGMPV